MPNVWITTDLHLWSQENDNRHPYRTQRQIDDLANLFAQTLREDDILIFLGDLCDPFASDINKVTAFVHSIPCTKYMCRGNHDTEDDSYYLEAGFDQVCDLIRMHNIIFSHKPLIVAPDEVNIHAHLHTRKMSELSIRNINAYELMDSKGVPLILLDDLLAYAAMKGADSEGVSFSDYQNNAELYMSLEHDHYNAPVDISDLVPLCPVDESTIVSDKDLMHNINLWGIGKGKCNVLYITGFSGSGKSTLAEQMERNANANLVELDGVEFCYDASPKKLIARTARTFPAYEKIFNEVQSTGQNHDWTDEEVQEILYPMVKRVINAAEAEKNTLYIVEGLQLYELFDGSHFKNKPIIVKGTSFVASRVRAYKRDKPKFTEWIRQISANWPDQKILHNFKKGIGESVDDVLDEIIFDDIDDTKFWLADDDKSRDKIDKEEESQQSVVAIDESTTREWSDQSYYYVDSTCMDGDILPAGKCIFATINDAVSNYPFKDPNNAGFCDCYVHHIIQGYSVIRSSDEVLGAYWCTDSFRLYCNGQVRLWMNPDGTSKMSWIWVSDGAGHKTYCHQKDAVDHESDTMNETYHRERKPKDVLSPLVFVSPVDDLHETVIQPRVPDNYLTKNGYEDNKTPRVCFSTSVSKALRGLSMNLTGCRLHVYVPDGPITQNKSPYGYKCVIPTKDQVPDIELTDERWILTPVVLCRIGIIEVKGPSDKPGLMYTYGDDKTAELYDWDWKWVECWGTNPAGGIKYSVNEAVGTTVLFHGSPNKYSILKAQASPACPDKPELFATPLYAFAVAYAGNPWSDLQINQSMHDGKHVLVEILPKQFDRCFNRPGYVYTLNSDTFAPFWRDSEWTSPTDVKPKAVKKIDNVLDELERSGTILYRYPDLPPWIPDRKKYMAEIIKKYNMTSSVDRLCKMYHIDESATDVINEMAYEDATDLMRSRLGHYCKEFNSGKQFEQLEKVWEKNWPSEKPPKLDAYLEHDSDTQLCFNLAHDINTDNDDGLRKVVTYTNIIHDLRKNLEKDEEIKKCAYITGLSDLVEDGVLLYVNLMGINAFSVDSPEVRWPKVIRVITKEDNAGYIYITYKNDRDAEVGTVVISSIDTDMPELHKFEINTRYQGKDYDNAIMRDLIKMYDINVSVVETEDKAMIELLENHGFKEQYRYSEWHANLVAMARGIKLDRPDGLDEAAVETHQMERDEKLHVAEKYDLRPVGQTHDEADKEAAIEREKKLDHRKKQHIKDLAKGRRTQKRNRFLKKLKSHLPGAKNEEAEGVDDEGWYLGTGHSTEDDQIIGDHTPVYKDDLEYENDVNEAINGYRFELTDHVQFFDRIDETAASDRKLYPVYVVLMQTGTLVATAIKVATDCEFSHASISFDPSLKPMYSFAGHKTDTNGMPMHSGFKKENLDDKFFKERTIPYAIYAVPCTKDQLTRMKKRLDYFVQNENRFYFDFTGLIKNFFGISDNPQNRWFCSRFVSDILNAGTPDAPLVKDPSLMRPEDFKTTDFAFLVDNGEDLNKINPKKIERSAKNAFKTVKLKAAIVTEGAMLHLYPDNPYETQVLKYQLATLEESAVDGFIRYLKSFKIRFDNDGNILITRREFDQLDSHFRESLRMIKAYENAGNVQGVRDELCKINYMIELINQYYLRSDTKNLKQKAKDVRKDMLDLRSVMMNAFRQHLQWVTMQDPKWNFKRYYDNSDYGKNIKIPKKVISDVGRTIITALS